MSKGMSNLLSSELPLGTSAKWVIPRPLYYICMNYFVMTLIALWSKDVAGRIKLKSSCHAANRRLYRCWGEYLSTRRPEWHLGTSAKFPVINPLRMIILMWFENSEILYYVICIRMLKFFKTILDIIATQRSSAMKLSPYNSRLLAFELGRELLAVVFHHY